MNTRLISNARAEACALSDNLTRLSALAIYAPRETAAIEVLIAEARLSLAAMLETAEQLGIAPKHRSAA